MLAIYVAVKESKVEEPVVRDVSGAFASQEHILNILIDPSFAQPRSVLPLIQTLTSDSEPQLREQGGGPQTSGSMSGPITTDMLRRALIATEDQMREVRKTRILPD